MTPRLRLVKSQRPALAPEEKALRDRGVQALGVVAVLAIELRTAGHNDAADRVMRLHQRLAETMSKVLEGAT